MGPLLKHTFLTLILSVFVSADDEEVRVVKKHSFYNTTETEVRLFHVNTQEIELEAFKDVSISALYIELNPLEELKKGIFINVSIHEMNFYGNNITSIEPGTFHDLHPLGAYGIYILDLSYNQLSDIKKGVFSGTKFRKLVLLYNKIESIEPGSFDDMPNLLDVDLGHNLLQTIGKRVFQNLGTPSSWVQLEFNDNEISHVDPYAFENTIVYSLDLQNNQLGPIDVSYFKKTSIGDFYV